MEISAAYLGLVPLVLALTEVIKRFGVAKKWLPVVAIVLGFVSVFSISGNLDWINGVIVGLSAMGLWSGGKTVVK